jgi:hypothetical protein
MTVGRIYHIEGELLRYVPEVEDWVAAVQDAPFGAGDTLFSGSDGMAELIVPNGIWIRSGNGTQLQFIRLDATLGEVDVASGTARFHARGKAAIRVTGDFGDVLADPGTIFDLYVGENSLEVVAIRGAVSFVHRTSQARHEVVAGSASVLADAQQVSLGDGTVDPGWNRWNMERENLWLAREGAKGASAEYLPPDLRNDAHTLDENGSWEKVPYEGQEHWFWRPTVVASDWAPFTMGRWTDWYGDQTWIPAEPFGYVTHHYGNWIYVRHRWYWAPPVAAVRIGLPLLDIGFFWSPGRVAWIHSGVHIGWVPLAPRETYYCRRPWGGPRTVVVTNVTITRIHIDVGRHAHIAHAVIVPQNHFHGGRDYRGVRLTPQDRNTVIRDYRAAPVVSDRVIRDYSRDKSRFRATDAPVTGKPHISVENRIRINEKIIHEGRKENVSLLQQRVKSLPEGKVDRDARVEPPRGVDPIVPTDQTRRSRADMRLPEREIKGSHRIAPSAGAGQSAKPVERAAPSGPAQPGQAPTGPVPSSPPAPSAKPPGHAAPAQPVPKPSGTGQIAPAQTQPARTAEQATPARPAPPAPSVQTPSRIERATPAPAPSSQPARPPRPAERTAPATPAQPQTPAGPGQVVPAQPAQTPQPVKPAEQATPARAAERVAPAPPPAQPTHTPSRPERPAQATPSQPARTVERTAPSKPEQSKPEQAAPQEQKEKRPGHP